MLTYVGEIISRDRERDTVTVRLYEYPFETFTRKERYKSAFYPTTISVKGKEYRLNYFLDKPGKGQKAKIIHTHSHTESVKDVPWGIHVDTEDYDTYQCGCCGFKVDKYADHCRQCGAKLEGVEKG